VYSQPCAICHTSILLIRLPGPLCAWQHRSYVRPSWTQATSSVQNLVAHDLRLHWAGARSASENLILKLTLFLERSRSILTSVHTSPPCSMAAPRFPIAAFTLTSDRAASPVPGAWLRGSSKLVIEAAPGRPAKLHSVSISLGHGLQNRLLYGLGSEVCSHGAPLAALAAMQAVVAERFRVCPGWYELRSVFAHAPGAGWTIRQWSSTGQCSSPDSIYDEPRRPGGACQMPSHPSFSGRAATRR